MEDAEQKIVRAFGDLSQLFEHEVVAGRRIEQRRVVSFGLEGLHDELESLAHAGGHEIGS